MHNLSVLPRFWPVKVLLLVLFIGPAQAATKQHWIGSWYASPTPTAQAVVKLPPEVKSALCAKPPEPLPPPRFNNATLRTVVHLTTGGDRLRLRLSNLYGRTTLQVGAVRVAANAVSKRVTFNGRLQVNLLPGTSTVSDAVDLKTSAGTQLAVSVFYPESIPRELTAHGNAAEINALTPGNTVRDTAPALSANPWPYTYFLTRVDVAGPDSRGTIVVIGDSITDGGARRWPALLAQRLSEKGKNYGVLNAGINGNRLLRDGAGPLGKSFGPSALVRFDREALDQPGVRYVILYEGINDLGLSALENSNPLSAVASSDTPAAADITDAMRRLAVRSHQRGLRMYVATLTPFEGTVMPGYYSPEKNEVREEVNEWIRTSRDIDGYLDFDHALADPVRRNRMSLEVDSCDHVHPNDAGERALSESVDLALFQ